MNETYQHPGKWRDAVLKPVVQRTEGNNFLMSHVIHGLERHSVYEAIVQAKNRYGWNEVRCRCRCHRLILIQLPTHAHVAQTRTYSH